MLQARTRQTVHLEAVTSLYRPQQPSRRVIHRTLIKCFHCFHRIKAVSPHHPYRKIMIDRSLLALCLANTHDSQGRFVREWTGTHNPEKDMFASTKPRFTWWPSVRLLQLGVHTWAKGLCKLVLPTQWVYRRSIVRYLTCYMSHLCTPTQGLLDE